jgi:hypothetical protein
MVRVAKTPSDELDLARLRALARKKPRTKAGQVRQAWPEIRDLLGAGHTLKDVCAWLNECGMEIGYARLSDYVNQLRRAQRAPLERAAHAETPEPTDPAADPKPQQPDSGRKKRDPLANVRASEARRPGFHYRPATPADEKDLI